MYNFYATVQFYYDNQEEPITEHIVVQGENFVNAMTHVEEYYGDDLVSINMKTGCEDTAVPHIIRVNTKEQLAELEACNEL